MPFSANDRRRRRPHHSDGEIRERRNAPKGILNVPDGRFGDTLREEIGPWLAAGEDRVLLSGMIGSRQGWIEAPYAPCPAGFAEIAAATIVAVAAMFPAANLRARS